MVFDGPEKDEDIRIGTVGKPGTEKNLSPLLGTYASPSAVPDSSVNKPPEFQFLDSEQSFEESIRHKDLWIDAFFLKSLIWSFGSCLNEEGRKAFNEFIKHTMAEKDWEREKMAMQEEENPRDGGTRNKRKKSDSSES